MVTTLHTLASALTAFKEFTKDHDVQVQAIQTFLKIATSVNPSMEDITQAIGLNQSTASRNVLKLATGPRAQEGYGLITVELDPYDHRRRLIKLSVRGHELMRIMGERTMPSLRSHFMRELLLN